MKRIFKAAFKLKNIVLLVAVLGVSYITEYLPFTLVGLAGYVYFVMQTLKDEEFQKDIAEEESVSELGALSDRCDELYRQACKITGKQSNKRMRAILDEKSELMKLYGCQQGDYLRQKVTKQALDLVAAFIKLIVAYNRKHSEMVTLDEEGIKERIVAGERRLSFLKDSQAINDMKSAVEMDKELLERVENGKVELERISAKLAFIESTLRSFKQQVIAIETEGEFMDEIQNIINEATALDQVLDQDKEDRLKL